LLIHRHEKDYLFLSGGYRKIKMRYNPQIHHRRSIRLKGYDYSQAGAYFITICCHNREYRFGKIADGEMRLNDAGKIANDCWLQKHFPNAILHEHIVMPNHVHGIIELSQNDMTDLEGVENFQPLRSDDPKQNAFQKIIPRSIGSIIRGYKIGVTKWFRNNTEIQTLWQRNYYEHIIRNEQSYKKISDYIINNPANWNEDKFFMK
jgi:putative transposase